MATADNGWSCDPPPTDWTDRAAYAADRADADYAAYAADRAALRADAEGLCEGLSVRGLLGRPLWPDQPPERLMPRWDTLKTACHREGDHWSVWTGWYEARLYGQAWADRQGMPWIAELEFLRCTLRDDPSDPTPNDALWRAGPDTVNAKIQDLEARYWGPIVAARTAQDRFGQVYRVAVGPDRRLHRAAAAVEDTAEEWGFGSEHLLADMARTATRFAKAASRRADNQVCPQDLIDAAQDLADALSEATDLAIDDIDALHLNQAFVWALRELVDAEAEDSLPPGSKWQHFRRDLWEAYQRLAQIYPALNTFRDARLDALFEPPTDQQAEAIDLLVAALTEPDAGAVLHETVTGDLGRAKTDLDAARSHMAKHPDEARGDVSATAHRQMAVKATAIVDGMGQAKTVIRSSGDLAEEAADTIEKYEKLGRKLRPYAGKAIAFFTGLMLG